VTDPTQFILKEFGWFINGLLALFLVWIVLRLFKSEPVVLFRTLLREVREFRGGQFTVGSINTLGFLTLVGVGIIIIILGEISHLVDFVVALVGREKVKAFVDDRSLAVFISLVCFLLLSIAAVLAKDYLRQKGKGGKTDGKQ